ncbi:hypothetical protein BCR42DRAFT_385812 [Absidia repens]|uniref:LIM zinc-binding domain-containing protein n=1 Tax=Absidia repens TaxID=90262 RepID=A0A1X2J024_9FUNG|nr:hypothetical protein BCR42DRAFT_385812 [Absidia repens]
MPYCKKCGELGRTDKCKKCGSILYTNHVVGDMEQGSSLGSGAVIHTKKDDLRKIPSILFDKKCRIVPSPSRSPISSTYSLSPSVSSPSPSLSLSTSSKQQANECAQCLERLSGKLVQLSNDESKKYHWSCLLCYECQQPFQSPIIYLDAQRQTYHPECFRCTGCQEIIKSASIYCQKDQTRVFCRPCHHVHFPQDQYTIANDAQWKVVPQPHQQYIESMCQYETYQDDANSSIATSSSAPSPHGSASINSIDQNLTLSTIDQSTVPVKPVHPSELMRVKKNHGQKKRPAVPQFGAIKVCPGCQSRIASVHEECTGPRAAKWHRQCLVCSSCRKVLDSSAKIHHTPEKDLLVPTCTTCLLKRKAINQKNNSAILKEWCEA